MSSRAIEDVIRSMKEFKSGAEITCVRVNSVLLGLGIKVERQHITDCLNFMARNSELVRDGSAVWRSASPAKKWLRAKWGKQ